MLTKKNKKTRPALGRGLASLISNIDDSVTKEYFLCDMDKIVPNKYQPRRIFNDIALEGLAVSIKKFGVLQPILIKKVDKGYELIAGERRLKASKKAGLTQIPAIIKKSTEEKQLEIALIENIQREDLNPIEEYKAYKLLMYKFELTQEELSKRLGKKRSTIANFLRLENLAEEVQKSLQQNKITMGHAKAILGIENREKQIEIAKEIIASGISVRETEKFVKNFLIGESKSIHKKPERKKLPDEILKLSYILSKKFKSIVKIDIKKNQKGKIEIEFSSKEDLDRITKLLKR